MKDITKVLLTQGVRTTSCILLVASRLPGCDIRQIGIPIHAIPPSRLLSYDPCICLGRSPY